MLNGTSLVAQSVESACNAGDLGSIPGSGRSPGEGNGNPLQYCCPENPSILAWPEEPGRLQSTGSQESDTTEQLSTHTHNKNAKQRIFRLSKSQEYLKATKNTEN